MGDAATVIAKAIENPFKGPKPLSFSDPIFGRDQEIAALLGQLISDRIVLLHSPSGCGKTSLVEAGLRKRLQEEFPEFHALETIRIRKLLDDHELRGDSFIQAALSPLKTGLPQEADHFTFAFFDQFEEIITAREIAPEDRKNFLKQMGLALDNRRLWVIVAIRDDYVGALQPYLRLLPTRLTSRFRLGPLAANFAEQAMEGICESSGVKFAPGVASQLAAGLAQGFDADVQLVEPVQLQVVCRHLWETCKGKGSIELADLGGLELKSVNDALGTYYADCMTAVSKGVTQDERKLRTWFGEQLIDRQQRTRVRVNEGGTPSLEQVDQFDNHYLIRKDRVQENAQSVIVELAHDRLVVPVLANNDQWTSARFGQPWIANAAQYEKTPSSHFLILGPDLRDALRWQKNNRASILPREEIYLKACIKKRNNRYRIIGLVFLATLACVAAAYSWWRARQTIEFANEKIRLANDEVNSAAMVARAAEVERDSARRAVAVASKQTAAALEQTEAAKKAEADAKQLVQEAKRESAEIAAQAKQLQLESAERVKRAQDDEKYAVGILDDTLKHLNQIRDEATSAQNQAKQAQEQAKQSQEKAKQESDRQRNGMAALRLAAKAQDERNLVPVVEALDLIAKDQTMESRVVESVLGAAEDVFSRGLLVKTLAPNSFPVALAVKEAQLYLIDEGKGNSCFKIESEESCTNVSAAGLKLDETDALRSAVVGGPNMTSFVGTRSGKIIVAPGKGSENSPRLRHEVIDLAVSSKGDYVAASGALWSFSVWKLEKDHASRVLNRPGTSVWGMREWLGIFFGTSSHLINDLALNQFAVPPKGGPAGLLAIARNDGRVQVWPMNAPSTRRSPYVDADPFRTVPPMSVAFNSDGTYLAAGSARGELHLWKLPPNSVAITQPTEFQNVSVCNGGAVRSIAFSPPAGGLVAAGCQDGSISILDLLDGVQPSIPEVGRLEGTLGDIRLLAFDPDRRELFSAGVRPGVEVWKIPTGAMFQRRKQAAARLKVLYEVARDEKNDTKPTYPSVEALSLLQEFAADKPETQPWNGYRSSTR